MRDCRECIRVGSGFNKGYATALMHIKELIGDAKNLKKLEIVRVLEASTECWEALQKSGGKSEVWYLEHDKKRNPTKAKIVPYGTPRNLHPGIWANKVRKAKEAEALKGHEE